MALVESGVVQQRLQAVLEVINAGATVRATTHLAATSSMVTGRTPARTELRSRSSLTRPGKRTAVVNRQWWKYTTPETRPSHAQEPRGERLSRLRPTLAGIGRPWIPNRGGRLMEAHPTKGRGQAKGGAMTSSVTRNIEIHAPVEEVFRFVSDPHRRTQAMSRALKRHVVVSNVETSPDGAVTGWEWTTRFVLPIDYSAKATRSEYVANKRIVDRYQTATKDVDQPRPGLLGLPARTARPPDPAGPGAADEIRGCRRWVGTGDDRPDAGAAPRPGVPGGPGAVSVDGPGGSDGHAGHARRRGRLRRRRAAGPGQRAHTGHRRRQGCRLHPRAVAAGPTHSRTGMTSTGTGEERRTFSDVLPRAQRLTPDWPWLAITIIDTFSCWAKSKMASAAWLLIR